MWLDVMFLVWTLSLFQSIGYFVVASTACSWYFGEQRISSGASIIARGFKWAFSCHFGSLALGSLLLPIFWIFRMFLQFLNKRLSINQDIKKSHKIVLQSLNCFVSILQSIVRRVNKHGYIQIALKGEPYFISAAQGFEVVQTNFGRLGVIQDIGEVVFFMGQLAVSLGITSISLMTFKFMNNAAQVNSASVLGFGLQVFVSSWMAASFFCALWEVASSSLLHCYRLDEEIHTKLGQSVRFASDKLLFALRTGRVD